MTEKIGIKLFSYNLGTKYAQPEQESIENILLVCSKAAWAKVLSRCILNLCRWMELTVCFSFHWILFRFFLQAAWGMHVWMVATCHWTASHEKGSPRSAYKASPLDAHLTPAKETSVAPPSHVLTCGGCTNAGTHTNLSTPNITAQSSTLTLCSSTFTLVILTKMHEDTCF